ncbi:MAG TPA: metalloregulator ArsR/SmtB family transcription factor [Candidatus Paceibacterota bacterium]
MANKLRDAERVLKAVANARRLAIIVYLSKNPGAKVGTIAEVIGLSFKSTSRHLSVLLSANIVERKQIGLEMHYHLQTPLNPIIKTSLSIL